MLQPEDFTDPQALWKYHWKSLPSNLRESLFLDFRFLGNPTIVQKDRECPFEFFNGSLSCGSYPGERDYLKNMENAFYAAFSHLGKVKTPRILQNLHCFACATDSGNYTRNPNKHSIKFLKTEGYKNYTEKGLCEIISNDKQKPYKLCFSFPQRLSSEPSEISSCEELFNIKAQNAKIAVCLYRSFNESKPVNEQIDEAISAAINCYYTEISHAHDENSKLYTICRLIATLERIHPFGDGNCRTICVILLNMLLIENGFSFAILNDPNVFDGYSIQELVNEVIRGMENFLSLIAKNHCHLAHNDEPLFEEIAGIKVASARAFREFEEARHARERMLKLLAENQSRENLKEVIHNLHNFPRRTFITNTGNPSITNTDNPSITNTDNPFRKDLKILIEVAPGHFQYNLYQTVQWEVIGYGTDTPDWKVHVFDNFFDHSKARPLSVSGMRTFSLEDDSRREEFENLIKTKRQAIVLAQKPKEQQIVRFLSLRP